MADLDREFMDLDAVEEGHLELDLEGDLDKPMSTLEAHQKLQEVRSQSSDAVTDLLSGTMSYFLDKLEKWQNRPDHPGVVNKLKRRLDALQGKLASAYGSGVGKLIRDDENLRTDFYDLVADYSSANKEDLANWYDIERVLLIIFKRLFESIVEDKDSFDSQEFLFAWDIVPNDVCNPDEYFNTQYILNSFFHYYLEENLSLDTRLYPQDTPPFERFRLQCEVLTEMEQFVTANLGDREDIIVYYSENVRERWKSKVFKFDNKVLADWYENSPEIFAVAEQLSADDQEKLHRRLHVWEGGRIDKWLAILSHPAKAVELADFYLGFPETLDFVDNDSTLSLLDSSDFERTRLIELIGYYGSLNFGVEELPFCLRLLRLWYEDPEALKGLYITLSSRVVKNLQKMEQLAGAEIFAGCLSQADLIEYAKKPDRQFNFDFSDTEREYFVRFWHENGYADKAVGSRLKALDEAISIVHEHVSILSQLDEDLKSRLLSAVKMTDWNVRVGRKLTVQEAEAYLEYIALFSDDDGERMTIAEIAASEMIANWDDLRDGADFAREHASNLEACHNRFRISLYQYLGDSRLQAMNDLLKLANSEPTVLYSDSRSSGVVYYEDELTQRSFQDLYMFYDELLGAVEADPDSMPGLLNKYVLADGFKGASLWQRLLSDGLSLDADFADLPLVFADLSELARDRHGAWSKLRNLMDLSVEQRKGMLALLDMGLGSKASFVLAKSGHARKLEAIFKDHPSLVNLDQRLLSYLADSPQCAGLFYYFSSVRFSDELAQKLVELVEGGIAPGVYRTAFSDEDRFDDITCNIFKAASTDTLIARANRLVAVLPDVSLKSVVNAMGCDDQVFEAVYKLVPSMGMRAFYRDITRLNLESIALLEKRFDAVGIYIDDFADLDVEKLVNLSDADFEKLISDEDVLLMYLTSSWYDAIGIGNVPMDLCGDPVLWSNPKPPVEILADEGRIRKHMAILTSLDGVKLDRARDYQPLYELWDDPSQRWIFSMPASFGLESVSVGFLVELATNGRERVEARVADYKELIAVERRVEQGVISDFCNLTDAQIQLIRGVVEELGVLMPTDVLRYTDFTGDLEGEHACRDFIAKQVQGSPNWAWSEYRADAVFRNLGFSLPQEALEAAGRRVYEVASYLEGLLVTMDDEAEANFSRLRDSVPCGRRLLYYDPRSRLNVLALADSENFPAILQLLTSDEKAARDYFSAGFAPNAESFCKGMTEDMVEKYLALPDYVSLPLELAVYYLGSENAAKRLAYAEDVNRHTGSDLQGERLLFVSGDTSLDFLPNTYYEQTPDLLSRLGHLKDSRVPPILAAQWGEARDGIELLSQLPAEEVCPAFVANAEALGWRIVVNSIPELMDLGISSEVICQYVRNLKSYSSFASDFSGQLADSDKERKEFLHFYFGLDNEQREELFPGFLKKVSSHTVPLVLGELYSAGEWGLDRIAEVAGSLSRPSLAIFCEIDADELTKVPSDVVRLLLAKNPDFFVAEMDLVLKAFPYLLKDGEFLSGLVENLEMTYLSKLNPSKCIKSIIGDMDNINKIGVAFSKTGGPLLNKFLGSNLNKIVGLLGQTNQKVLASIPNKVFADSNWESLDTTSRGDLIVKYLEYVVEFGSPYLALMWRSYLLVKHPQKAEDYFANNENVRGVMADEGIDSLPELVGRCREIREKILLKSYGDTLASIRESALGIEILDDMAKVSASEWKRAGKPLSGMIDAYMGNEEEIWQTYHPEDYKSAAILVKEIIGDFERDPQLTEKVTAVQGMIKDNIEADQFISEEEFLTKQLGILTDAIDKQIEDLEAKLVFANDKARPFMERSLEKIREFKETRVAKVQDLSSLLILLADRDLYRLKLPVREKLMQITLYYLGAKLQNLGLDSWLYQDPKEVEVSTLATFINDTIAKEILGAGNQENAVVPLDKKTRKSVMADFKGFNNFIKQKLAEQKAYNDSAAKSDREIAAVAGRTFLAELSGYYCDACWTRQNNILKDNPSLVGYTFVENFADKEKAKIIGGCLSLESSVDVLNEITDEVNTEGVLVVRGLNPQASYLRKYDVESFVENFLDYMQTIARRRGLEYVALPLHRLGALSNRPEVYNYLQQKYGSSTVIELNDNINFNGYSIKDKCVIVRVVKGSDYKKKVPKPGNVPAEDHSWMQSY